MGAFPVPLRIRLPSGSRNRGPAAQLVSPEEAEDDAEGREDEEEEDRQEEEAVHCPEDVSQLHPAPMRRREERRRRGGEDQQEDAGRPEDDPRHDPPLPAVEKDAEEREKASHDEAEPPVFLHVAIVAGSPAGPRDQAFARR